MKVWVLYEVNNDLERGYKINNCYGVFINKKDALNKYENIEYLRYENSYEDDLEKLCDIIEKGKKELDKKGKIDDYTLVETNFYC